MGKSAAWKWWGLARPITSTHPGVGSAGTDVPRCASKNREAPFQYPDDSRYRLALGARPAAEAIAAGRVASLRRRPGRREVLDVERHPCRQRATTAASLAMEALGNKALRLWHDAGILRRNTLDD